VAARIWVQYQSVSALGCGVFNKVHPAAAGWRGHHRTTQWLPTGLSAPYVLCEGPPIAAPAQSARQPAAACCTDDASAASIEMMCLLTLLRRLMRPCWGGVQLPGLPTANKGTQACKCNQCSVAVFILFCPLRSDLFLVSSLSVPGKSLREPQPTFWPKLQVSPFALKLGRHVSVMRGPCLRCKKTCCKNVEISSNLTRVY
jgi:hypothetical protein